MNSRARRATRTERRISGDTISGCIFALYFKPADRADPCSSRQRGKTAHELSLFNIAVEELLAEDFEPACNLYIASGHNEEIFGDGIHEAVKYFEKQGIEFEFAVDEGGGVISAPIDGIDCKCAMIAVHEKGYHRINVRAVQGDSEGL